MLKRWIRKHFFVRIVSLFFTDDEFKAVVAKTIFGMYKNYLGQTIFELKRHDLIDNLEYYQAFGYELRASMTWYDKLFHMLESATCIEDLVLVDDEIHDFQRGEYPTLIYRLDEWRTNDD